VVDVFDDLFGLAVTCAVGVLEGRQCALGDTLGRPHHPLENPAVAGSAVAVASVKVGEGLRGQDKFLQLPEVEEAL
jgi:hypothetical protein